MNQRTIEETQTTGLRWHRIALTLLVFTITYNLAEAGVALWSGWYASSVVLVGFGFDSVIECAAASMVLWRITFEARSRSGVILDAAEKRVHRFVGFTFYLLALYVLAQSAWTFIVGNPPEESFLGIALAVLSLIIMPLVAWGKLRAAEQIGSRALRAEAKETLACSYLSLTLLIGLGANAVWGWWWADPVAALAMAPWLIHEGREAFEHS